MTRKRTQVETRQAILETSELLFRRQGYDAASITEIAAHCLMSPGNIYHVFRNKADIAEALLRRSLDGLVSELDSKPAGVSRLEGGLTQAVLLISRHLDRNADPVLFDLWRRAATENWGVWETLLDELRARIHARLNGDAEASASSLLADAVFRAALAFIHPALTGDEHRPTMDEEAALLFTRIERQHVEQRKSFNDMPGRRSR